MENDNTQEIMDYRNPKTKARLFQLFNECPDKSNEELERILLSEGYKMSKWTIREYRYGYGKERKMIEDSTKANEMIIDSIEKTNEKFQKLLDDAEAMLEDLKANTETTPQAINTMRLIYDMLKTAMEHQGRLNKMINKGVVINNNYNELNMFIQDLGARVDNGRVVIDNPKPELIEVLTRQQKRKSSKEAESVKLEQ